MGNFIPKPPNDECVNAIAIENPLGGTVFNIGDSFTLGAFEQQDQSNAWADLFEAAPKCQNIGDPFGGFLPDPRYGVWYTIEVAEACEVDITLSTCNSDTHIDTAIAVYKGGCANLQCFGGGADDVCGDNTLQTELDIDDNVLPTGTEKYYILVYSGNNQFDGVFGLGDFTLTGTVGGTPTSSCGGDPHFSRWKHDKRDSFHGECDLVLLHTDTFQDNTGLDVHVRTTMQDDLTYSYIESTAVRIGEMVLEFNPKFFLMNGEKHGYDELTSFEFEEKGRTFQISSAAVDQSKRETTVKLNHVSSIKIRSTKNLMYVNFQGRKADFGDSVGMLGNYTTGEMVGRFGIFNEDYMHYGFEWQVDPNKNDPILFAERREPQLPYERCRMPAQSALTSRRRLRSANSELHKKALAACQGASSDVDLCVDDVMATGDITLAQMFMEMV